MSRWPARSIWLLLLSVVVLAMGGKALGQDPVKVDEKHYKVVYEDDHTRILKVTLGPGERAANHSHPAGTTLIHLTSNKATFTLLYSNFGDHEVKSGAVNQVEDSSHSPQNDSATVFEALIVEIKKEAPQKETASQAAAKPGQVEEVCADRPIPLGWVLTDSGDTDFTKCPGFNNVKTIRKVTGLPAKTKLTVCKDSPVPDGWTVTGTSTDFERCGPEISLDNLKEILRKS